MEDYGMAPALGVSFPFFVSRPGRAPALSFFATVLNLKACLVPLGDYQLGFVTPLPSGLREFLGYWRPS